MGLNIDRVNGDISTSSGGQPTLGSNIILPADEAIKENFIIGGDLATNGTNPYQRGTSGTDTGNNYAADRILLAYNISFTTPPTWARTADGLTVTSNEATTHSNTANFQHKVEGYESTRLFSLSDYFTLQGNIKSSLSGNVYVSIRSSGDDYSYVFPVSVSAGVTASFSEVIPVPTSGTFGTGNNQGFRVTIVRSNNDATTQTTTFNAWQSGNYISGSDQLDLHATNGATMSIDKLKIEPGQIKTPFWTPDYGEELRRGQRYYSSSTSITWTLTRTGATQYLTIPHKVAMRGTPVSSVSSFVDTDASGLTVSSVNASTGAVFSIVMSGTGTVGDRYAATFLLDAEL